MGSGVAKIPEALLLEHAKGNVLLVTGAGTSRPSGLPSFRELVLDTYETIDPATHAVLKTVPDQGPCPALPTAGLNFDQCAEVRRFHLGEYDVALGMLERRIDGAGAEKSKVRERVAEIVRRGRVASSRPKPAAIHRALMRLADRGGVQTIATTNFDLLLEGAASKTVPGAFTQSLGAIPRPGRRREFAGILHIHGALEKNPEHSSNLVVTDQDFGEFYLRRRVVPDFIYDAARLFNIVLVGYSLSDAPMRYLLNSVAADGSRFSDLKDRFAFVASDDPVDEIEMRDWRKRGIIPIPYAAANNHVQLSKTLTAWARLSAVNGDETHVERLLIRIVKRSRASSAQDDKDLFDYLMRRSSAAKRQRYVRVISDGNATEDWLSAINAIEKQLSGAVK